MFMDSQSLSADPHVVMGAWAMATERLKLSPGVTNPLTRHLAVTAASIATVHDLLDALALGLVPKRMSEMSIGAPNGPRISTPAQYAERRSRSTQLRTGSSQAAGSGRGG